MFFCQNTFKGLIACDSFIMLHRYKAAKQLLTDLEEGNETRQAIPERQAEPKYPKLKMYMDHGCIMM